jgi:hypothetical protein
VVVAVQQHVVARPDPARDPADEVVAAAQRAAGPLGLHEVGQRHPEPVQLGGEGGGAGPVGVVAVGQAGQRHQQRAHGAHGTGPM